MSFNARIDCDGRTSPTGECMSFVGGYGPHCQEECMDTRNFQMLEEMGLNPEGTVDLEKFRHAKHEILAELLQVEFVDGDDG